MPILATVFLHLSKRFWVLLGALIVLLSVGPLQSFAAPPEIRTVGPVIYVADNLDEKDNLGYCIDTVGCGLSDRIHLHSCKPRGGDVEFSYDVKTQQIKSATFENLCVELRTKKAIDHAADTAKSEDKDQKTQQEFKLVRCRNKMMQRFSYNEVSNQFHLTGADNFCLVAGSQSRAAGPFMSRNLELAHCVNIRPEYKTWTIQELKTSDIKVPEC
jgi:hypothetical protein